MKVLDALHYWKRMQKKLFGRNVNPQVVYKLSKKLNLSFLPPNLKEKATS